MKNMLVLFLFSLPGIVLGRSTWELRKLPERKYLFRTLNLFIENSSEVRKAELKTHDAVDALFKEAVKFDARAEGPAFFHHKTDLHMIDEAGLVVNPGKTPLPVRKYKILPAGTYFVLNYLGPSAEVGKALEELPGLLKKKSLKIKTPGALLFKKSVIPEDRNEMRYEFHVE